MKNTKIFSTLAAFALTAFAILPAFAAGEYLPDVENVTATVVSGGIQITWDAVAGADQYTLYYGTTSINTDGATYEENVLLDDVTQYLLTGLTPETKYYLAVAADDSTGSKFGSYNYSEEISVTTPATSGATTTTTSSTTTTTTNPSSVTPDPVVDPLADTTSTPPAAQPTIDPAPVSETEPVIETAADIAGQKFSASGEIEPSTEPQDLPKSGPELAIVFLMSGTGTYLWRKYRK